MLSTKSLLLVLALGLCTAAAPAGKSASAVKEARDGAPNDGNDSSATCTGGVDESNSGCLCGPGFCQYGGNDQYGVCVDPSVANFEGVCPFYAVIESGGSFSCGDLAATSTSGYSGTCPPGAVCDVRQAVSCYNDAYTFPARK